MRIKNICFF
jgi:hypothetical protein